MSTPPPATRPDPYAPLIGRVRALSLPVRIASTALYAPPRVETAEELAPRIGESAEWIVELTGVARRHLADGIPVHELGAEAARRALGDGPPPDLIVNASLTPWQCVPDTAVFIERALGLEGVPAYTIHATCLSFLVALQSVAAQVATGISRRALIVSAEAGSIGRNFAEPESASLIGDGAAAAVLEPTPDGESSALLAWAMTTLPAGVHLTEIRGGGTRRHPNDPEMVPSDNLFHMDGLGVYRLAVRPLRTLLPQVLAAAGLSGPEDIDLIVPHQASRPSLLLGERLGLPAERTIDILAEYGNCIAASIPMALAHADAAGRLNRGDHVLLIGTGAGLSIAAAVLRW